MGMGMGLRMENDLLGRPILVAYFSIMFTTLACLAAVAGHIISGILVLGLAINIHFDDIHINNHNDDNKGNHDNHSQNHHTSHNNNNNKENNN